MTTAAAARAKIGRRHFLGMITGAVAGGVAASVLGAQEETRNTVSGPMDQMASKSVRLPPKSGVAPHVSEAQRDDLEHKLQCQCGCTLDVFTCRTTDFSCSVSPSMHMDVMGLIAGGYDVPEILAAFRAVYGERVLMSPVKEGFNWLGYLLPFVAIATASVLLFAMLKRWSRPEVARLPVSGVDATPDEMERLDRVLRSDE